LINPMSQCLMVFGIWNQQETSGLVTMPSSTTSKSMVDM